MSSQRENQAAYLTSKGTDLEVRSAPVSQPGSGQLLIRNHAVAINPVDWKMQDHGAFIKTYPVILGCDLAGEVVEVGPDVSGFRKGDRVLAHALSLATGKGEEAGFQLHTVVHGIVTAKIPDDVSFAQACVLPLSISTASAGLYGKDELNLPYPSGQPEGSGKVLLLWGGSSSVGSSVIQLAVASGVEVVTTCSKRNFDYVKGLGARAAFDYSSPSVVGDLVAELQKGGKELAGAYDAVGERESSMNAAQVLAQLGGGYMANVLAPPEDLPATVTSTWVFAPNVALTKQEIGKAVYGAFLPAALKSGQVKSRPEPDVVGTGLDSIQKGIAANKAGVSASKIVIEL